MIQGVIKSVLRLIVTVYLNVRYIPNSFPSRYVTLPESFVAYAIYALAKLVLVNRGANGCDFIKAIRFSGTRLETYALEDRLILL